MKKLLILLSLCVFVIACSDRQKPAMDVVGDMMTATEEPFAGVPRITISDALMQDKITGPWLWMIAPTELGQGGADVIDIDSLALASNSAVTEMDVATNGVAEGDTVGELAWTLGTISGAATQDFSNNLKDLITEIGLGEGNLEYYEYYSSYALINLVSDTDQSDVTMSVGSDDAIKVWLNSEVVHIKAVDRGAMDFQESFTVDLKAGDNLLLVKVSNGVRHWAMYVGLGDPSKPTEEVVEEEVTEEEVVEEEVAVEE